MKTTFTEFARGRLAPSPSPPPPSEAAAGGEAWGPARRVAFRFAFAYVLLYFSFGPLQLLGDVPPFGALFEAYDALLGALTAWAGRHVLQLPAGLDGPGNGSGDTTSAYVALLCKLVLAVVATAVWSLLARRRLNYARLHEALRTYVRYTLAYVMFIYGMGKVIQTQFPTPVLDQLARTYGESSPMGLLWTFMGYSTAYNAFAGAGEVLGAALLFFRRTTTLGALVITAVMANVVMLNFCYDVPVKQFSSHLLLMALLLLAADARRLVDALVLGRATDAVAGRPVLGAPWLRRARLLLKPAYVAAVVGVTTSQELAWREEARGPKAELHGTYQVESFEGSAGGASPATAPWVTLTIARASFVMRRADGTGRTLRFKLDSERRRLGPLPAPGGHGAPDEGPLDLAYERPDPEHLHLEGTFENERVVVRLKKVPAPPSLLMSRGFHWVNEFPYNR